MFPFQKIFTLLIRTFSRPMLGYVKRKQIEKPGSRFAYFFVGLGRRTQVFEHWVNHRVLKTVKRKQAPELSEEILLQKGIESFYEALFYIIVLGLPFWELYRSSVAAQKKEETLQKRIANLERKMGHIGQRITKIVDYAKERSKLDQARQARRKAQLSAKDLEEKQQIRAKMSSIGETTSSQEQESISEKIEEMFENAIEVMADEFEDSLDDLQFSSPDSSANDLQDINQPDAPEAQIQDIGGETDGQGSDLLEDVTDGDSGPAVEVSDIGSIEVQVDTQASPITE